MSDQPTPASPYTHLDRPPLRGRELDQALTRPDGLWQRIQLVASTGSTNADAAAAAQTGAPHGLVIVAEHQTAGRGRLDRGWTAPPRSGLTFSVLLRPTVPAGHWHWLSILAALATSVAVAEQCGLEPRLKWPNDLLLDDRKLAGVLAERIGDAVVVGVGLNVSLRAEELPVENATSLLLAGAEHPDRDRLLRAVLRTWADWYQRWEAAGGDPVGCGLRSAYLDRCATLGRQVRVELPAGQPPLYGEAVDLDESGRLVVRSAAGDQAVGAGDVVHVR